MQTKTLIGIIAALALATGLQAQPATLASLRSTYLNAAAIITAETHKQKDEALVRYGNTLEALATSLKQKGDLESFMVVDAEKTRYLTQKTVPTNTPPLAVADAVALYGKQVVVADTTKNARMIYLLRQYTSALGILVKELMVQNKIEEAKATSEVKSGAEFELAELEATMPVVTVKTNTVTVASDEEATRGKIVRALLGKWNVSGGGFNAVFSFGKDGTVVCSNGSKGRWTIEDKRVLIDWNNGNSWDSFTLPLSKSVRGDSKFNGINSLEAKKIN